MKPLFALLVLTALISCSKSKDKESTQNTQPYMKYKGNGILYEFNERDDLKITRSVIGTGDNVYKSTFYLSANKSGQNLGLDLRILSKTSTSLEVNTYYMTADTKVGSTSYSSGELVLGSTQYWDKTGDYTQIQIIKLQNGYANGTFTASITKSNSSEKYLIQEGEFRNVKVVQ